MASKKQYALWCKALIEGNEMIADTVYEALLEDGFIKDERGSLIMTDEEERKFSDEY